MSLCFFGQGHFKGEGKLWGGLLIKGGGEGGGSLQIFFWWGQGELGKKGWGQYFRVGLIPWSTLCSTSTFIQIFQKVTLKKKNQTIWKIFTSLFNSLLIYKLRQNTWNKIGKSSKIGQYKKSLISTFPYFLTPGFSK